MFLNRPKYTDLGTTKAGRAQYRLDEDLCFESRLNGGAEGIRVRVPAGFVTDLASVPLPLHPIFPPAGPWSPAAIMHDYLYHHGVVSRFLADALFREAMAQLGVPVWRRVLAYYAVRLFGRRHRNALPPRTPNPLRAP